MCLYQRACCIAYHGPPYYEEEFVYDTAGDKELTARFANQ